MKDLFTGKFIVLDGPDGCGKSTQSHMLADWISRRGGSVVGFRDPGDTVIGDKIRRILLSVEHELMTTRTEVLLYMAARAQLWHEKLAPAIESGKCVVMDRWLSSTCAYQGYAGQFGVEKVLSIAADSLERVRPDLTLILDVDLQTAAARLDRKLDRMELKGDIYHQKVRQGFLELAGQWPQSAVIDAGRTPEEVHRDVTKVVFERLS